MKQLGPFHHHLTMRLVSYIVYSPREWQVHTQECFHTSVSISRTDDTIHHSPSSPSWDLQCTAQMFVPLGGWIGHFYVCLSFLLSYCITSVGLWTTWSQVKIPHSIHLLGWSCLLCLQRVEPSTGMLQNFSVMNLDLCTVVWKVLTGIWHRFGFCHTTCCMIPN